LEDARSLGRDMTGIGKNGLKACACEYVVMSCT
jgi:hypothetical protein